ncbi:MAG: hypothetical protein OMM_10859 [Candidatus Magnetoglobus multicellularis str. Araruama]|uniref:Uncharacterized protein n=1 Tax=Candidatus Magnetoglobus multicellularis str. Araruama TaxID=890399 RepID=A0A1V1NZW4_9BACT|nr:MAG: hypothetical protein OMM_10859 [Candidatus Magnetoglobus multicellularis str. Araruama]
MLIEEFGKEYGNYFSILELLSLGTNTRTQIESLLEMNIGGYLDNLEKQYHLISKKQPFNAKKKAGFNDTVLMTIFSIFGSDLYTGMAAPLKLKTFRMSKKFLKGIYRPTVGHF